MRILPVALLVLTFYANVCQASWFLRAITGVARAACRATVDSFRAVFWRRGNDQIPALPMPPIQANVENGEEQEGASRQPASRLSPKCPHGCRRRAASTTCESSTTTAATGDTARCRRRQRFTESTQSSHGTCQ